MFPDGEDYNTRIWDQIKKSNQKAYNVFQFWFLQSKTIMWNDTDFYHDRIIEMMMMSYGKKIPILPLYPTVTLSVTD